MNDGKEDNEDTLATYLPKIASGATVGGVIGDTIYDTLTNTISINTGNGYSNISVGSVNSAPADIIIDGSIKVGELVMEVDQFETCLRYLLEITKQAKPEEFI